MCIHHIYLKEFVMNYNHGIYNKKNFIYPCNLNGAFSRAKYYLIKNSIAEKEAKVDAMVLERRYGIFC